VLVSIEPTELQYAVEMQRAAVRQVRAQLGIGPNDPPPSDPTKVAIVQRAAADLLDAKQKYDRATLTLPITADRARATGRSQGKI